MTFEHEDDTQEFGRKLYEAPTLDLIHDWFGKMDLKTCSFYILTGDDGSYVQCAGIRRKLAIEYRQVINSSYKQFMLGVEKEDKSDSSVHYSSGSIKLKKNEILTIDDVRIVFDHFFKENSIPLGYLLRELNEDYY